MTGQLATDAVLAQELNWESEFRVAKGQGEDSQDSENSDDSRSDELFELLATSAIES